MFFIVTSSSFPFLCQKSLLRLIIAYLLLHEIYFNKHHTLITPSNYFQHISVIIFATDILNEPLSSIKPCQLTSLNLPHER